MPPMPDMPDLRDYQVFTTSSTRLGIDAEQLTKQLGEYFGAPGGEGVLVRSVERDSPAEKAGIKAGDVVLKVDGEKIATVRDLRSALRDRYDKKTWSVTLLRNHKEMSVTVNNERSEHHSDSSTPGEKV
jgi:serine protease Do